MFKVIHKETEKLVDVYDIIYEPISGYPQFLIYEDNQWLRKSAKYFRPCNDKKKRLLESNLKDKEYKYEFKDKYEFEDGM